jgi:hypothetical protein
MGVSETTLGVRNRKADTCQTHVASSKALQTCFLLSLETPVGSLLPLEHSRPTYFTWFGKVKETETRSSKSLGAPGGRWDQEK